MEKPNLQKRVNKSVILFALILTALVGCFLYAMTHPTKTNLFMGGLELGIIICYIVLSIVTYRLKHNVSLLNEDVVAEQARFSKAQYELITAQKEQLANYEKLIELYKKHEDIYRAALAAANKTIADLKAKNPNIKLTEEYNNFVNNKNTEKETENESI